MVNVRLDDLIYLIFRQNRTLFAPPHEHLTKLRLQLELDRNLLRKGQAPAREHLANAIKKHARTAGITLPIGCEDEFAGWVYDNADRCPGLNLNHEVYRALMENLGDIPETADFSDLAHVYALPYVDAATLDRRMRHYCRLASDRVLLRGASVNYDNRICANFEDLIQRVS